MSHIETLRANLPGLSPDDRRFAQSLLTASDRYGRLTEKQAKWVEKLAKRATHSGLLDLNGMLNIDLMREIDPALVDEMMGKALKRRLA